MIKKEYYRACDLFLTSPLEKSRNEYFNDFGYNLKASRKKNLNHFKDFCFTKQNNCQNKAKKIVK